MPVLEHPDLPGRTIVVDENRAVNRRATGWVDVTPDDVEIDDPDPDATVDDD